jgi:ABC-type multidrug transport system ATPase subunit
MSEPILRALMQLFALISDIGNISEISSREKDVVKSFLARHLNNEMVEKYFRIFDEYLDLFINKEAITERAGDNEIPALKAMRIKRICEGINKELRQKQKIYIIIQLIDFISYGKEITENELDFLMTVALALNVPENEYKNIKSFIIDPVSKIHEKDKLLLINSNPACKFRKIKHIYNPNLSGELTFLNIISTKTFVLRYTGDRNLYLNGQHIFPRQSYLFDNGSTIKGQGLKTVHYSEVFGYFNESKSEAKVSLSANDVTYRFADSENGIQNFNFYEESGQLIGILGVSGTGKSTLLNLLNGNLKPQSGNILINGYDINNVKEKNKLKGIIGYIPQDDLLIEELTVYQNLYYNARLCLSNLPVNRIRKIVSRIMIDLDLWESRDLKVGNPLDKVISGGQRKRINIALELVREPYILFVDEPTSGLSSVDSEVVINLLKEQTYKGKLVVVNIHQPGSDLFKLFDKIIILDKGGYQIFYGNPNAAIVHFKTLSRLANPEEDQCTKCGNINTDQILQIVEAKIVNEHGRLTQTRKVTPEEWSSLFRQNYKDKSGIAQVKKKKLPENFYSIPGRLKQMGIFFTRDLLSKLANRQYILISFLGAPLLALLLGYFTRYSSGETYEFIDNDNLTAYIFMCVITSLFLGLIISSEEILKDRKILKRESFLNLSWFSYINSKIIMMFLISAIQTISFIFVGNSILGIKGMTFQYWLVLFTTSCCANMIGLNLSLALNSVITIYILIPFILIPQLLFSGVLVKYDKLHISRSATTEYVPLIGELWPARWSYEALAVEQFKNNRYEKILFPYEMKISRNEWYASYLLNTLQRNLYNCRRAKTLNDTIKNNYRKLNYYIGQMSDEAGFEVPESITTALKEERLDSLAAEQVRNYLGILSGEFKYRLRKAMDLKDSLIRTIATNRADSDKWFQLEADYYNKGLASFVLNDDPTLKKKSVEKSDRIIQKFEPGFMTPTANNGRAHFCAPFKIVGNTEIDTFWFNVLVIWLVSLLLYIALYFNILRKMVSGFGDTNKRRSDSSFLIIKEISSW